jgi:hypothetical protein
MAHHLVGTILMIGTSVFVCVFLVPALLRALRTGQWSLAGTTFVRSERPMMFWAPLSSTLRRSRWQCGARTRLSVRRTIESVTIHRSLPQFSFRDFTGEPRTQRCEPLCMSAEL